METIEKLITKNIFLLLAMDARDFRATRNGIAFRIHGFAGMTYVKYNKSNDYSIRIFNKGLRFRYVNHVQLLNIIPTIYKIAGRDRSIRFPTIDGWI